MTEEDPFYTELSTHYSRATAERLTQATDGMVRFSFSQSDGDISIAHASYQFSLRTTAGQPVDLDTARQLGNQISDYLADIEKMLGVRKNRLFESNVTPDPIDDAVSTTVVRMRFASALDDEALPNLMDRLLEVLKDSQNDLRAIYEQHNVQPPELERLR